METLHFLVRHHREILYFLLLWHVQLLYNSFCSQNEDVLKYDFFFHFGDVPASAIFYIYITFMFACQRWYCSVSSSFMYILSTFSSNVPFHHSIDILSAVVVLVLMLKKKSYYSAISSPIDSVTTTLKWTFGRITLLFSLNWFVCRLPMNTIK